MCIVCCIYMIWVQFNDFWNILYLNMCGVYFDLIFRIYSNSMGALWWSITETFQDKRAWILSYLCVKPTGFAELIGSAWYWCGLQIAKGLQSNLSLAMEPHELYAFTMSNDFITCYLSLFFNIFNKFRGLLYSKWILLQRENTEKFIWYIYNHLTIILVGRNWHYPKVMAKEWITFCCSVN